MIPQCQICENGAAHFSAHFLDGSEPAQFDMCNGCVTDLMPVAETYRLTVAIMPLGSRVVPALPPF